MASNPVSTNSLTSDRVTAVVGTVTSVITSIAQIAASAGLGGALNLTQIEQLTKLFGNLAGVAVQAAHDVSGKPVTPESVMALMPEGTVLAPAGADTQPPS